MNHVQLEGTNGLTARQAAALCKAARLALHVCERNRLNDSDSLTGAEQASCRQAIEKVEEAVRWMEERQ